MMRERERERERELESVALRRESCFETGAANDVFGGVIKGGVCTADEDGRELLKKRRLLKNLGDI